MFLMFTINLFSSRSHLIVYLALKIHLASCMCIFKVPTALSLVFKDFDQPIFIKFDLNIFIKIINVPILNFDSQHLLLYFSSLCKARYSIIPFELRLQ